MTRTAKVITAPQPKAPLLETTGGITPATAAALDTCLATRPLASTGRPDVPLLVPANGVG